MSTVTRDRRLAYERRILDIECELERAMRVAEEARTLAAIMRRNTDNLDDALTVASKGRPSETPYPVEPWMPAVIAVEKAIAELTGIDSDDELYWKQRHAPESDPAEDAEAALAAATGTAKTPKAVECEASQSGPQGNAQPSPSRNPK